jgi:hypothetical protein
MLEECFSSSAAHVSRTTPANPLFNYNVYFDKGDMENEIFQPHRAVLPQRGSILCALFSPSSATAQSKLIAFDLKRNLPRHLFVSSGAKSGLNATHAETQTHNGPLFRVHWLCDSNRASSFLHTIHADPSETRTRSGFGSYLLLPSINPPALANNVYAITVLARVTHCV